MSLSGTGPPNSLVGHASAVALGERQAFGVLIEGPSGSGKSALALQLMALGGRLVADDRTTVALQEGHPWIFAPDRLQGVIEARGIGLIQTPHVAAAPLKLVVDMGTTETERLPDPVSREVLGRRVRCIRRVDGPHFAGSIIALSNGEWWWHDR